MFTIAKSYSFGDCRLSIGNIPIGGYDEDGGITFEWLTPERTSTVVGADGQVTAVQTKDRRLRATVRLMETSTSCGTLYGLHTLQDNLSGPAQKASYFVPFAFIDPNTGESVSSPQTIFEGPAGMTKDQNPSVREWRMILPNPLVTPTTL